MPKVRRGRLVPRSMPFAVEAMVHALFVPYCTCVGIQLWIPYCLTFVLVNNPPNKHWEESMSRRRSPSRSPIADFVTFRLMITPYLMVVRATPLD